MININGKYAEANIFTDNVEETALEQIKTVTNSVAFHKSKIRIMPDVHAGAGCVIGFTTPFNGKVIPNIVGVDIACGMRYANLGKVKIDFDSLDKFISHKIPHGFHGNKSILCTDNDLLNSVENVWNKIKPLEADKLEDQFKKIGSLGGGNHFIEINIDDVGDNWLVIHSGSRNFGLQIAKYHQKVAVGYCSENKIEIEDKLEYLENDMAKEYFDDVSVATRYAIESRKIMFNRIADFIGVSVRSNETLHNYIDFSSDIPIIRKGAVSAKKGEELLIPLNMRDGSLVCIGKGNDDWNQSAPHGAGRILSRNKAKKLLSLDDFKADMSEVYTSCVRESTLDESPRVYKPAEEIISAIGDTVGIVKRIKPVYNFKS